MIQHWTFGQRIGAGFALTILLALAIGAIGIAALRSVVRSKDAVIDVNMRLLIDAKELAMALEAKSSRARAFLLSREERFLTDMREARSQFVDVADRVRQVTDSPDSRRLLETILRAEEEHQRVLEQVIALRRTDATIETVSQSFETQLLPVRDQIDRSVAAFVAAQEDQMREGERTSMAAASNSVRLVLLITLMLIGVSIATAILLSRALGRQIGSAVGQVQSSSSELQAAANQQASGAREQATAMSEISTTIHELLATSRQIAESARRVAQIAQDATGAAAAGEQTMHQAQHSIVGIQRQVELIVGHMLELGRKSQHIGAVLDIVSELAEQTNILAINATIEAAGAGESGRRFAVVADEIRKLADRVGGSTKEIRLLIDDVRSAVNTTVMATEAGAKTVDAGAQEFDHVASVFAQIARLIGTTTEAGREIELSTKQQMTAVEQVNVAIGNIAQASRESEASSSQTLQTASQLAKLSKELLRLVQPGRAAA